MSALSSFCRRRLINCFLNNNTTIINRSFTAASKNSNNERMTSFGFQQVSEKTKVNKVQEVFSSVAGNYDVMNDVMSLGLHRLWKDYFVTKLAPPTGSKIIDVAGGTGDIASRIVQYNERRVGGADRRVGGAGSNDETEVTVVDLNKDMLEEGEKRFKNNENIKWLHGDALSLPFPSNHFDGYTIAFGIRNVSNFEKALSEAYRVIKAGGRYMCMEFSNVENTLLRNLYDVYSFQLIPVFGELIAQDRSAYQYLVESIREFPDQERFSNMIKSVGFVHVHYESLLGGVVAIHSGFKPK